MLQLDGLLKTEHFLIDVTINEPLQLLEQGGHLRN